MILLYHFMAKPKQKSLLNKSAIRRYVQEAVKEWETPNTRISKKLFSSLEENLKRNIVSMILGSQSKTIY